MDHQNFRNLISRRTLMKEGLALVAAVAGMELLPSPSARALPIFAAKPEGSTWGSGHLDVVVIKPDFNVYHLWGTANGSSVAWRQPWENIGGPFWGVPVTYSWGPNRLDVFARKTDHSVWHKWWDGTAWHPSQTTWEQLSNPTNGMGLSVVSWTPGRLDIFVLDQANRLWHKYWDQDHWVPGPGITEWEDLQVNYSDVSSVSWASNRVDLFGVGGGIYHRGWDGTTNQWVPAGGWESLGQAGGNGSSYTVPVSWSSNHIDLFTKGGDGAIWHKWWDGTPPWKPTQTTWESLGGFTIFPPAAIARLPGSLYIFAVGANQSTQLSDSSLWLKWGNSSAWTPSQTGWIPMHNVDQGFAAAWPPSVVLRDSSHIDLFIKTGNNHVAHATLVVGGTTSAVWEDLG